MMSVSFLDFLNFIFKMSLKSFKSKKSLKSIDPSFYSDNNEMVLGEILASKEDAEEEKIVEIDDLLNNESFQLEEKETNEEEINNMEECQINLDDINSQSFETREELKNKVIMEWGSQNKMKLNFRTRERVLIKEDVKVSTILCSKKDKLNCPFYLEFKADSQTNCYKLSSFWNTHNHSLCKYDSSKAIDNTIMENCAN